MDSDLAKLAAKVRPLAQALIRPEDAKRSRVVDRATRGGDRIALEETKGTLPARGQGVIDAASVQVESTAITVSTNLAGMLQELVSAITNLIVVQEFDGNPMGAPQRIIFPSGTLSWDADRREMLYEESAPPPIYLMTTPVFHLNDVPASATTAAKLLFMDTTTTVKVASSTIRAGRTGEIVGLYVVSDVARTTGTLIARPSVGGVTTAFDGDAVTLDNSPTTQMSQLVAPGQGIAIASGSDQLGIDIVTSGWAPTTANVFAWMIVRYASF